MTLADAVSPRNVAHAALLALQEAEAQIMPPDGHSRLFVAITCLEDALAYLSFPTRSGRTRLRLRLEDVQRVESTGVQLGNLNPDSLIQAGLSLAIFVAQTTLAGVIYQPEHALDEARRIVRLAARTAA